MNKILIGLTVILLMGCQSATENSTKATTTKQEPLDTAKVPEHWVEERVKKAKDKLNATEAGQLVWQAMEAHGGLANWFSNGPISFQFDYQPRGKGARRNTSQIVDTWSNKSVHHDMVDKTAAYGWNGKEAWVTMKDTAAFDYNLRFWALTPIYFLAQPFNFDGAGVKLEKLEDKSLDDVLYDAVKISFEQGTGDAPDDYYINYYDKKTHQLKVLRYIVSYPKYFKDGGHSPEKIMTLHDFKSINNITLPTSYKTYMLAKDETRGEYVTDISVSDIKFLPDLKKTAFERPEGTKILNDL